MDFFWNFHLILDFDLQIYLFLVQRHQGFNIQKLSWQEASVALLVAKAWGLTSRFIGVVTP